jgi:hypothetical protein
MIGQSFEMSRKGQVCAALSYRRKAFCFFPQECVMSEQHAPACETSALLAAPNSIILLLRRRKTSLLPLFAVGLEVIG